MRRNVAVGPDGDPFRMDVALAITRLDADVCHAAVDNSLFCQQGNDSSAATA